MFGGWPQGLDLVMGVVQPWGTLCVLSLKWVASPFFIRVLDGILVFCCKFPRHPIPSDIQALLSWQCQIGLLTFAGMSAKLFQFTRAALEMRRYTARNHKLTTGAANALKAIPTHWSQSRANDHSSSFACKEKCSTQSGQCVRSDARKLKLWDESYWTACKAGNKGNFFFRSSFTLQILEYVHKTAYSRQENHL